MSIMKNMRYIWQQIRRKNSFSRDIVVLLVISAVLGAALAGSVSYGADAYFSKTVASLVGDYGEYDIVIQTREEIRQDAAVQIQKIISEVFPGAKFKEGPTITSKTSFFVGLPEKYKTKKIYEDLNRIFSSIPGGAGVGVMTEPRFTLRGVPEGAKIMLMDAFGAMEGVRFAFRDGNSIGIVLLSANKASLVTQKIQALLEQYQVLEISFPVGTEPANPIRTGEELASKLQQELKLEYAKNVSIDEKNNDMTYMVSTMMEIKRFLTAYAAKVSVNLVPGAQVVKGDSLSLKENVILEITAVRSNQAEGIIKQGDASQVKEMTAYKLVKGVVGEAVGQVKIQNPRADFSKATLELAKVTEQIPGFALDAKSLSTLAVTALDNYGSSLKAIDSTLVGLDNAGSAIQTATGGLAKLDTSAMQAQLNSSSQAMGGIVNTLNLVKLINNDISATVDTITGAQKNLNTLAAGLQSLDRVAADARKAQAAIDRIVNNGQDTLTKLRAFDVTSARTNLLNIESRLAKVDNLDVALMSSQLTYLAAAVPDLKDEEISHSISILDKFISGQVIPGARIQILTTRTLATEAAATVINKEVGHDKASIYSAALGVIEPNPRTELFGILNEVRAVLAGMTAIAMTILLLLLDHTAIMAVIRYKRRSKIVVAKGIKARLKNIILFFTAQEKLYGMVMGASILSAIFYLAKAQIPYLGYAGVPVLGAVLGLIAAHYAEKISPVAEEELMAGEALGLSFDDIMRELVIPAGRPGLLQKLNTRKMKFK